MNVADAFVPDGRPLEEALARTTLLGVGAHQDDLEFMAFYPILKAFTTDGEWFTGVTVTNARSCGSIRSIRSRHRSRRSRAETSSVRIAARV